MSGVPDDLTVEFGPLERRGMLLGVSGPSLTAVGDGEGAGLLLLLAGGSGALVVALAAMGVGIVLAFLPVQAAPLAEWVTLVVAYGGGAVTGRLSWRSGTPRAGVRLDGRPAAPVSLPEPLARARTRIVAVPWLDRTVGVLIEGPLALGEL